MVSIIVTLVSILESVIKNYHLYVQPRKGLDVRVERSPFQEPDEGLGERQRLRSRYQLRLLEFLTENKKNVTPSNIKIPFFENIVLGTFSLKCVEKFEINMKV